MPDSNRFFVELDNPATAQEVAQALRRGGIEPRGEVREVSASSDGIIFTDLLARRMWEWETGQKSCLGHCLDQPGSPRHVAWEQLSGKQQDRFTADVGSFMDAGRRASYRPIESNLEDNEDFDGIALQRCRPQKSG